MDMIDWAESEEGRRIQEQANGRVSRSTSDHLQAVEEEQREKEASWNS
jgi:hypothetical protein